MLPGVDELLALTEVRRLAEDGPWETIVVDCGPTAETLRLLALPEAVSGYLTRVFGRRGRVTDSVRRLGTHLDGLRALLTEPSVTTVRLVLTPERVVVAEARRTLSSLALRGIAVDGLIANRLMPAPGFWRGGAASWLRTRRTQQDAVLAELSGAGFEAVSRVEHRAVEPVGLPALLEIAAELYRGARPAGRQRHPGHPAAARPAGARRATRCASRSRSGGTPRSISPASTTTWRSPWTASAGSSPCRSRCGRAGSPARNPTPTAWS